MSSVGVLLCYCAGVLKKPAMAFKKPASEVFKRPSAAVGGPLRAKGAPRGIAVQIGPSAMGIRKLIVGVESPYEVGKILATRSYCVWDAVADTLTRSQLGCLRQWHESRHWLYGLHVGGAEHNDNYYLFIPHAAMRQRISGVLRQQRAERRKAGIVSDVSEACDSDHKEVDVVT